MTDNNTTTQPTQTTPAPLPPDTRGPLRRPRPREMQDMQQHVVEMQRYPIGSPERNRLELAFFRRWRSFAEANCRLHRGDDVDENDLYAAATAAMMMATRNWREFDPVTGLRGRPVDCWLRQACKWSCAKTLRDSRLVRSRYFAPKRDLVSIQPGPVPESARHAVSEDALVAPDNGDDDAMKQRLEAWDRLPENQKQALREEHGQAKRTMSDIKRRTLVKLLWFITSSQRQFVGC